MEARITNGHFQGRKTYGFELIDPHGRVVWSGHGFVSPESLDDAIEIARRATAGRRPRLPDREQITTGAAAFLEHFVKERWGAKVKAEAA